jgi:hypothetical protein
MPRKRVRNRAMENISSETLHMDLNPPEPRPTTSSAPSAAAACSSSSPPTAKRLKIEGPTCNGLGCRNRSSLGTWYKCVECQDFVLCKRCADRGSHDYHLMLRVTTPEQVTMAHAAHVSKVTITTM